MMGSKSLAMLLVFLILMASSLPSIYASTPCPQPPYHRPSHPKVHHKKPHHGGGGSHGGGGGGGGGPPSGGGGNGGGDGGSGSGKYPPPPPVQATCPIDALKLGLCVDVLGGLVHIGLGNPVENACCPVLGGLLEIEAAICLCTTLKIKLLNLNIFIPLAVEALISCGMNPPPAFVCPPL